MIGRRALLTGLTSAFACTSLGVSIALWSHGVCAQGVPKQGALPRFVVGTSLIADILADLLPGAEIRSLSQGSTCPIHGDMKSQDVFAAFKADMIVVHGFQKNSPTLKGILAATKYPDLRLVISPVGGNWMAPPVQKAASIHVAQVLVQSFPAFKATIESNLMKRLARIDAITQTVESTLAPLRGMPVICSMRQADFLVWAGFKVEATYLTAQDLSPLALIRLIRLGREKGVVAIIDNQQSGADLGGALASELKLPHVTLSNFPIPNGPESSFFTLLKANVDRLATIAPQRSTSP